VEGQHNELTTHNRSHYDHKRLGPLSELAVSAAQPHPGHGYGTFSRALLKYEAFANLKGFGKLRLRPLASSAFGNLALLGQAHSHITMEELQAHNHIIPGACTPQQCMPQAQLLSAWKEKS